MTFSSSSFLCVCLSLFLSASLSLFISLSVSLSGPLFKCSQVHPVRGLPYYVSCAGQWPSLAYRGQCRSLRVSWQESRPLTVAKQVSDFGLQWTQVCGERGQWPTADSLWPRQGLGQSSGPWLKLARWCYPVVSLRFLQ